MPGSYANMTVAELYTSVKFSYPYVSTSEDAAVGWIEAENIFDVRAIIIEWFDALNDGTANDRYPDPICLEGPPGKPITEERADKFIEELEADMLKEWMRFGSLGREAGPGFDRLEPHARMAFMQAVWQVMKTMDQIQEEAAERTKAKELPPAVLNHVGTPTTSPDSW